MSDHCPHCRDLQRKADFLADLVNKKDAEIVGMQREKLEDTRTKIALRGMLTKQRRQEDINQHVMGVARKWQQLCSPRSSIAPTGKNVEQIRVAFINYCRGNPHQRRKLLYDAVRGYALRPYDCGYGERWSAPTKNGKACVRRVTTAYIFASEERIEQGAAYWRLVNAKPLEWKRAAWLASCDVENLWLAVYVQESRGVTRDSSPRYIEPPKADRAAHLLLPDNAEHEAPAAMPADGPQRLFVIEGGGRKAA